MKKTFLITAVLLLAFTSGFAQKAARITFDAYIHDFGKIKEDGGFVNCTFHFTNTGDDSLKITKVTPGCGCTTAEWTQTAVPPGGRGYLKTTFDPKNRPGPFQKAITINTNDPANPSLAVSVKGEVLPRQKTYLDFYPNKIGNLRFASTQYNLGNVKNTVVKTDTMKVYNDWKNEITFSFNNLPPYLSCYAKPEKLKPQKEGMIILSYDASKRGDFGYLYDRVIASTNDSAQPGKTISISVNIVEDFASWTPEMKQNAPRISFASTTYDFGKAKHKDKVEFDYVFTNTGKSDLIIRKTKASCGCTALAPEKTVLKPGESSKIHVVFDTNGKLGKQHKTVTVICNDPETPTIVLNIQGTVEEVKQ